MAVYLEAEQRAEIQRIAKATASQVYRAALEHGRPPGNGDRGAMTDGVTVLFGAVGAILAVLVPVVRKGRLCAVK